MAVFTHLTHADIESFIKPYGVGVLEGFTPIQAGIENTNYCLTVNATKYILTVFEGRTDPAALPFIFEFMDVCRANNIQVAHVLKNLDGQQIGAIAGKAAVLVEFIQGAPLAQLTLSALYELGAAVARMHNLAGQVALSRVNPMSFNAWQKLIEDAGEKLNTIQAGLYSKLKDKVAELQTRWPQNLAGGAVHADIFPDNVFWQNGHLAGIIDFYYACTDALIYDFAITANAWCFDHNGVFNKEFFESFCRGYEALRPLPQPERDCFALMGQAAALRIAVTRCYDYINVPQGALVTPKNPHEYLKRLEFYEQNNPFNHR